jgi:hypothetical protein
MKSLPLLLHGRPRSLWSSEHGYSAAVSEVRCVQTVTLDIAVEVRKLPGDSGPFATFSFEGDGLTVSIQSLLPIPVDLQWYGGPAETPTIHAGLERSSILIYKCN